MSVLGLDVGTSTCKGVVLTLDGEIIAQPQIGYADSVCVIGDKAEIPAEVLWDNTAKVIRELTAVTAGDPIEAIAVSSHGESLIQIGASGEAIFGTMLSMDRRCMKQSDALIRTLGQEKIYHTTGSMMHPQFPVPKVMWIQEEQKELGGKTVHYDTANDYIMRRLGIPNVVDYSMASRFGGFDIHKRAWSEEILGTAGIKKELFSEPVCGGTVLGKIPSEIARDLGLKDGVSLVAGGHDQPCASIGMGYVSPGTVTVSAGSYECAVIATGSPLNDHRGMKYGLNSYCHVLPNQYVTLAFFVSGMMTTWYLDTFCQEEKRLAEEAGVSVYQWLENMATKTPSGICMTPHIYGSMNPEWSERQTTKITGITAGSTKGDLYRAVLEGTACELDLNLRVLEKLSNPIQKLLMTGGGTKSKEWMQIRADVTEKEVFAVDNGAEASCVGAAILAGIGIGMFKDTEDANAKLKAEVQPYVPKNSCLYEEQKEQYLQLHRPGLLED